MLSLCMEGNVLHAWFLATLGAGQLKWNKDEETAKGEEDYGRKLCMCFSPTPTLLKHWRGIGKGNLPTVAAFGQRQFASPWCLWMSLLFCLRVTRTTASTSQEDSLISTGAWMGTSAMKALLMCWAPMLVQGCQSHCTLWTGWEIKHFITKFYMTETGWRKVSQWVRAVWWEWIIAL